MEVYIKMGQPMGSGALWGDFHYAYALKSSLQNFGMRSKVLFYDDLMLKVDAEIVLLGLNMAHYRPSGATRSVAWLISHPEQNDATVLRAYDFALVCSRFLSLELGFEYFPQAYDSSCYGRDECPPWSKSDPEFEVVFVGNVRTEERFDLLNALGDALDDVHVWGHFKNGNPRITCHSPVLPAAVNDLYRRAKVVIGHHLEPARRNGLINDRVYSVIASGAFLLSDAVLGINDSFPGLVTYNSPVEAVELCRKYLYNEGERFHIAKSCRRWNAANSFDHRAARLSQLFS
jgi:hypothetical protein